MFAICNSSYTTAMVELWDNNFLYPSYIRTRHADWKKHKRFVAILCLFEVDFIIMRLFCITSAVLCHFVVILHLFITVLNLFVVTLSLFAVILHVSLVVLHYFVSIWCLFLILMWYSVLKIDPSFHCRRISCTELHCAFLHNYCGICR